jgi:propanol-preferring alcohol dehydrogenase
MNSPAEAGPLRSRQLLVGLVVFLFFAWGFGTVLNDTLIPKLKGLYALSYTEVMLTQFCFFLSYFVFSIPAGLLLSRIGYIRGVIVGLIVMAAGCALFYPASTADAFGAFLLALFVIAAGMTMLQVAANPYIELLGPESTSHSRLTLAQAFNSFATFIGPLIGARLLLRGGVALNPSGLSLHALAALRTVQTRAIAWPYLAMTIILLALAMVFWTMRASSAPAVTRQAKLRGVFALLNRPRLVLGAVAIFIYVGAEVSIGSVMTNYLMQSTVLGAVAERAGTLVSFYWGGAMIGRFIGVRGWRVRACDPLIVLDRRIRSLDAHRGRSLQFHHVSHDFQSRHGAARRTDAAWLGPSLHGDRWRRGRASGHRGGRGPHNAGSGIARPGGLLHRHRRLRRSCGARVRARPQPAQRKRGDGVSRMMRAMRLEKPGAPLVMIEQAHLVPGPGQIRVAVHTCAVCRTDLHVVDGELPNPKLPIVPGHEIVGRVESVGAGVNEFVEGDRVGIPWLGWTCGACEFCLRGEENLCPAARFTGYQIDGGFASEAIADARFTFSIPQSYSDEEASPLMCAGLIGWRSLKAAGEARKLGIYGFGAAAHIVVQVARARSQDVYAFVRPGDASARAFALKMGAVWSGDSDAPAPEPLDAAIIFAPVGALVPSALNAVRPGGIVVCGGIHMATFRAFPIRSSGESDRSARSPISRATMREIS